jgi:DnaJ-domain-containing protein 1
MKDEGRPEDRFEVFGPVGSGSALRPCATPGCPGEGAYRAPVSREQLHEYRWFCLDHVRIYNASWNYYAGLSDTEMEAHIRSDTTWNRPTWPLGKGQQPTPRGTADGATPFDDLDDPFGLLNGHGPRIGGAPPPPALTPAEKRAFSTLGLDYPVTFDELRTQYKLLVKRHHPDTHNGAKDAEERLKRINEAYKALKTRFFA